MSRTEKATHQAQIDSLRNPSAGKPGPIRAASPRMIARMLRETGKELLNEAAYREAYMSRGARDASWVRERWAEDRYTRRLRRMR